MSGNIIAYDKDTYDTLSLLKESINWYSTNNNSHKYDSAITVDTRAYKEYLKDYVRRSK